MKMSTYLVVTLVTGALGLSTSVQAGGYGYDGLYGADTGPSRFERRVDRRQERQWDRIRHGIDSGELSRREARRLIRNQKKISRMERRFERDGYYSPREKRKMERALDRASKRIRRLKEHDYRDHGYRHGWRRWHPTYWDEPYTYDPSNDSYLPSSSSSASITAQTDGFSVSWERSRTN